MSDLEQPAHPTEPTTRSLPCLACGKVLFDAFSGQDHNQPNDGIVFTSPGNYGSTIFDPFDDAQRLEVNICDECVLVAAKAGRVLLTRTVRQEPQFIEVPWTGPEAAEL